MAHGITKADSMFSVREKPWHGLGVILPDYPKSIEEALIAAGLDWQVTNGDVMIAQANAEGKIDYKPAVTAEGTQFKANVRDNGDLLGIVTSDYKVVQNKEAFQFLDALINSDLYFETAGSIWAGRRVWVLARLPEFVEVGGDQTATYIYVANSHDGSLAVTAAVTPIRIVCNNTLSYALDTAQRTYRFKHMGDLNSKFADARRVLDISINYQKQFKIIGDQLALEKMSAQQFESKVLNELFYTDDEMTARKQRNAEARRGAVLDIFNGNGPAGDTRGNAPGTKYCAANAVVEYADFGRRYTKRTNQVQRSFEDSDLKQRSLELIVNA